MKIEFSAEWCIKAAAALVLLLAGWGKLLSYFAAAKVAAGPGGAAQPDNSAALCLGLGLLIAAPLIGGLLKPKATP